MEPSARSDRIRLAQASYEAYVADERDVLERILA